jgi:hypothetical protein
MTTTSTSKNSSSRRPAWYTDADDSAWDKIKEAFQRDWTQTKHDFGADEPNLDQQVGDTVSQAVGSKPIPPGEMKTPHPDSIRDEYNEIDEPAYRYGYAASRYYGLDRDWDDETEESMQKEWGDKNEWERQREAIRRGWNFGKSQNAVSKPR